MTLAQGGCFFVSIISHTLENTEPVVIVSRCISTGCFLRRLHLMSKSKNSQEMQRFSSRIRKELM